MSELPSKVLVIDNDEGVLNSIKTMLAGKNINCEAAKNFNDGLYHFNNARFDMVIVDLKLEGMPGTVVLQRFRSSDIQSKRESAAILLVGQGLSQGEEALARELEAVQLLEKPVVLPKLLVAMQHAMQANNKRNQFNEIEYGVMRPLLKNGKFEKVLQIAKEKLEPLGNRGMFKSAEVHSEVDRKEEALSLVERLVESEPKNIQYLNEMGKLSLELGNLDKAKESYEKADAEAPNHVDRMYEMARMYLERAEPGPAVEQMKQLLSVTPDDPNARYGMYDQLFQAGFAKHAQDFCKETSTPKEVIRHFNNKGVLLAKEEKFSEAIEEYKRASNLIPGDSKFLPKILFNEAISCINLKELEYLKRAKTLLQKVLSIDPKFDKAKEKLELVDGYIEKESGKKAS